jgi:hypothetical protein
MEIESHKLFAWAGQEPESFQSQSPQAARIVKCEPPVPSFPQFSKYTLLLLYAKSYTYKYNILFYFDCHKLS